MQSRLDIILETVDQILEGAKRAKERTTKRTATAGDIMATMYIGGQPGNAHTGAQFVDKLARVIKHSPQRIALAHALRSYRRMGDRGRARAQGILNIESGRGELESGDRFA
jgi:hypothetical protein